MTRGTPGRRGASETRARFSIADDLRWKKDAGVNVEGEQTATVRVSATVLKSGGLDEVRRV